ncbi:ABC transporter ATP-binding protein [Xanthobacter sp. KR7-65]|uniref:ABC transporter ATP-binding protein n=1 Tax=Xanthobacter sp. KR7-65 TaxID=3156612 RepID=UPI0032B4BA0F
MSMQEKSETQPILSMNSVEVLYDNVMLAIKGVSVQVPRGEMIALLGSNGAGKSTTLKAISGLLKTERGRISRGEIRFEATDITEMLAQKRVEMGICHVIEGRRVFEHLTPDENLTAAAPLGMSNAALNAEKERIYSFFPRLAERKNSQAGYLSGGEQQMLAIGRALVTQPTLLMLDEPSLGLAPFLVEEIFGIIKKINQEHGLSVLLVEQNALAALEIVSEGYLIENGRVVMHGTAETLKANSDIQEFYLGGAEGTNFHEIKHYSRRKRWLS